MVLRADGWMFPRVWRVRAGHRHRVTGPNHLRGVPRGAAQLQGGVRGGFRPFIQFTVKGKFETVFNSKF